MLLSRLYLSSPSAAVSAEVELASANLLVKMGDDSWRGWAWEITLQQHVKIEHNEDSQHGQNVFGSGDDAQHTQHFSQPFGSDFGGAALGDLGMGFGFGAHDGGMGNGSGSVPSDGIGTEQHQQGGTRQTLAPIQLYGTGPALTDTQQYGAGQTLAPTQQYGTGQTLADTQQYGAVPFQRDLSHSDTRQNEQFGRQSDYDPTQWQGTQNWKTENWNDNDREAWEKNGWVEHEKLFPGVFLQEPKEIL